MNPVFIALLIALAAFIDDNGEAWPSLDTLAAVAHLGYDRTKRALAAMERVGLISRRRRVGNSTLYRIAARFFANPGSGQNHPYDEGKTAQQERSSETSSFLDISESQEKRTDEKTQQEGVSERSRERSAIERAIRRNMLVTLRRWVHSRIPNAERADYLAMLGRAEGALDDWRSRSPEDKRWLNSLKDRADLHPLDDQTKTFHYLAERGAIWRSKRHWRTAMAATRAASKAAGLPEMPCDTWRQRPGGAAAGAVA